VSLLTAAMAMLRSLLLLMLFLRMALPGTILGPFLASRWHMLFHFPTTTRYILLS
jgi:hypothetical protein